MTNEDKATLALFILALLVAISVVAGMTINSMNNTNAKTTQIKVCVSNGGSWVSNTNGWPECRK